jgi:hypothetical protein
MRKRKQETEHLDAPEIGDADQAQGGRRVAELDPATLSSHSSTLHKEGICQPSQSEPVMSSDHGSWLAVCRAVVRSVAPTQAKGQCSHRATNRTGVLEGRFAELPRNQT